MMVGSGRTRISLLPRSADRAYVFWEIARADLERTLGGLDSGGEAERFFCRCLAPSDTEARAETSFEIECRVGERWLDWEGGEGDVRQAQLVAKLIDGQSVELARSRTIELPRREAGSRPVRWVERDSETVAHAITHATALNTDDDWQPGVDGDESLAPDAPSSRDLPPSSSSLDTD